MDDTGRYVLLCCLLPIGLVFLFGFGKMSQKRKHKAAHRNVSIRKLARVQSNLSKANTYEILLPNDVKWEPDRTRRLLEHLMMIFDGGVLLQIVATHSRMVWQVVDASIPSKDSGMGITAIRSIYPEAEVIVSKFRAVQSQEPQNRMHALIPLELFYRFMWPIVEVYDLKAMDPLVALSQAMSGLPEGESIAYTVFLESPISPVERREGLSKIEASGTETFARSMVLSWAKQRDTSWKGTGQIKRGKFVESQQRVIERKLVDRNLFHVYAVLQIEAKNAPSLMRHSKQVLAILREQFGTENNRLVPATANLDEMEKTVEYWVPGTIPTGPFESIITIGETIKGGLTDEPSPLNVILSVEEAASIWHLPHDSFTVPEIDWLSGGRAPQVLLDNTEGILIGDTIFAGRRYPIYLPTEDRDTHMNIVGRTGVGKSTLMHNMIHQDIAMGRGVGVIDPHGKLVSDILRTSIPSERKDDVVLLDIANEAYPPPLNPMLVPGHDESYTAGEVVAILEKMEGSLPPRVADTLAAAFVTLRYQDSPTVRDVIRLFSDVAYRYHLINQVNDVITQEFWDEFERQSPSVQRDLGYPVIHRLRKFYRNPILHPILCHPEPLDFRELIRQRKIILVSLGIDQRKVPDMERRLVGSIVVTLMQMSGMASLDNPTPFFLYIDEVQNFATSSLDVVFEEARKYQLHLTVGNQYLGQLQGKTLESVMGTVGSTVVFQVGQKDARTLAPYFRPDFAMDDLVNLDKFAAVVKTRFKGSTLPGFFVSTRSGPGDADSQQAEAREATIRKRSIERYTKMTKKQVLDWLQERYPGKSYSVAESSNSQSRDMDWVVGLAEDEVEEEGET